MRPGSVAALQCTSNLRPLFFAQSNAGLIFCVCCKIIIVCTMQFHAMWHIYFLHLKTEKGQDVLNSGCRGAATVMISCDYQEGVCVCVLACVQAWLTLLVMMRPESLCYLDSVQLHSQSVFTGINHKIIWDEAEIHEEMKRDEDGHRPRNYVAWGSRKTLSQGL